MRQWVLSFPLPLRYLLAAHPDMLAPILKVVNRTVSNHLIDKAGFRRSEAKGGAVTLMMCRDARMPRAQGCARAAQRFGSAANLTIHLHALVLDGVYREEGEALAFHAVSAPTDKEITAVLGQIVTQTMALLTRAGYVTEEEGRATVASDKDDGVLAPLQAASITYRIAYGPRQGQKLLTLQRQSALAPAEKKRLDAEQADSPESPCYRMCGHAYSNASSKAMAPPVQNVVHIDLRHTPIDRRRQQRRSYCCHAKRRHCRNRITRRIAVGQETLLATLAQIS